MLDYTDRIRPSGRLLRYRHVTDWLISECRSTVGRPRREIA